MRAPTVGDIADFMDRWAPPHLAEDWDRVGLQLGSRDQPVGRVLLAVDLSSAVVEEALARAADLIVCHHPAIFRPVASLTDSSAQGRKLLSLARAGVSVFVAHTNLDAAHAHSTSDALARAIGLFADVNPLVPPAQPPTLKLVTYVPPTSADTVFAALAEAGAGCIGQYSHCSYRVTGHGTFLPGPGTHPAVGEVGRLETTDETRLETIVPPGALERVLSALHSAHPYEEPAYDVFPLHTSASPARFARRGTLREPMSMGDLCRAAASALGAERVGLVGDPTRRVTCVAVCAGSGGSLVDPMASMGFEAMITGELGHHDALSALDHELSVIMMGHHTTERPILDVARERLIGSFGEGLEATVADGDGDPLRGCAA